MPAPKPQPDPRSEALRLLARFVATAIRDGRAPAATVEVPRGRANTPMVVKDAS